MYDENKLLIFSSITLSFIAALHNHKAWLFCNFFSLQFSVITLFFLSPFAVTLKANLINKSNKLNFFSTHFCDFVFYIIFISLPIMTFSSFLFAIIFPSSLNNSFFVSFTMRPLSTVLLTYFNLMKISSLTLRGSSLVFIIARQLS